MTGSELERWFPQAGKGNDALTGATNSFVPMCLRESVHARQIEKITPVTR